MIDPAYYFGTKEQIVEYILPPMAECLVHNHGGLWYLQIKSGFSEGLSVALDEYRQDGFKKAWDGLQSKVSKHFTIMFMLHFNLNIFCMKSLPNMSCLNSQYFKQLTSELWDNRRTQMTDWPFCTLITLWLINK